MALLKISSVGKSFGATVALKDVSFEVFDKECLALVGENGAGKSTLMKILSGVWPHGTYEGEIIFDGKPLQLRSTLEGRSTGISIIHQELCLFPKLSAAENLFLTDAIGLFDRVRWDDTFEKAQALFDELGFDVDARAPVEDLSVAGRQLVEIARAFHHKSRLLILDEPTSALSHAEVGHLFGVIRRMRDRMTFIYISHKLDEVTALSDRIVVLRDGRTVATLQTSETKEPEIIRHMVGRPLGLASHKARPFAGEPLLKVENLSHVSPGGKKLLQGIQLDLRRGEILGIAGLMGAGRSELLRSILGVLPGDRTGTVRYDGLAVEWHGIQEALDSGVAFVPEDRKRDGLFLDHGIDFNLTISILKELRTGAGWLDLPKEQSKIEGLAKEMAVKCGAYSNPVKTLSGGNQQKVLLAKVVASRPKVLFLDEPTRGIDIGAKEEIYSIIRRLSEEGLSLIVVSSELPEILSLCDRVIVLREGRLAGELVNDNLSQETIMTLAAGTEESHAIH